MSTPARRYAEILLPQKVGFGKDTLTYELPEDMKSEPGTIVEIPLRNNKTRGIILSAHDHEPTFKTKKIIGEIVNIPHLRPWQVELMKHIADYYFCPLYKALKLFLPSTIIKSKKTIADPIGEEETTTDELNKHELSNDQKSVLEGIRSTEKRVSLLFGVTGSGKTEIYMRLAEDQLKQGKQALILIPEISLTPQTLNRFEKRFPNQTSVINSQISIKERKEHWQRISSGSARVVVGSRSAIFAPFKDLGLIVIDEEHEPSYKQDQSPRYNTISIAEKIAVLVDIKVLLGSATPSLESFHKAKTGTYGLFELPTRIQFGTGTSMPKMQIIDLREEIKKKNFSIFSEDLSKKISQKLKKNEQSILFINRRGAASAVICRECGFIVKCKHCEVSMTYHKKMSIEGSIFSAERLICHHCGLIGKVPVTCPICQSVYIRYIGLGTQRVEEEVKQAFPKARLIRADSDTVQKKDTFKQIYYAFKNHEADILIGTQMIGKGLHLPKVNLVGIMLADLSLGVPDFRNAERTFQLITQVAGRAGREGHDGEVVIQTYMPDNYAIQMAALHNYQKFFEKEISIREKMGYPPFKKLIKLTVSNKDEKKCRFMATSIFERLTSINHNEEIEITHYPALISRLNNKYRWHILLTGTSPEKLLKTALPLEDVAIDVDPISIN